ncbi:MAG: glutamine--fructose-6-phosphate aminotransferase, partial [Gemmatimonadota bacterium]
MCGIVGYIGPKDVVPILIGGLKRLEYRGYDSAGVAVLDRGELRTRRAAGKIAMLEAALGADPVVGHIGIGHTRWATHGPPTDRNAHPHLSTDGTIAVVHNGIIENYGTLKTQLAAKGHRFSSDTDTEVLACLIQACYEGSLEDAVVAALRLVEGTYGIAVVSSREPQKIVGARQGSPLLVGVSDGQYFLASDASAILAHTRDVVYLSEGEIAVLTSGGYRLMDIDAAPVRRSVETIAWDLEAIERGGCDHFMLKEIFEQPTTVANTLRGRLRLE